MFAAHPAYRAQIDLLERLEGFAVGPVLPRRDLDHERWGRGFEYRLRCFLERRFPSFEKPEVGEKFYFSGFVPPAVFRRTLDRPAHFDVDDPFSLLCQERAIGFDGEASRRRALAVTRSLGKNRTLSFWSDSQMRNFLANLLPEEYEDLLRKGVISVLRPSLPPQARPNALGATRELRCLVIANSKFWRKGAGDAVAAVWQAHKRGAPIQLTLVSEVIPPRIAAFMRNKPIFDIRGRLAKDELWRIFSSADVLLFPSHYDTYGWVVLEAKSFGVPSVVTDFYNRYEFVRDGVDGVLLRDPFANPFMPREPFSFGQSFFRISDGDLAPIALDGYFESFVEALLALCEDRKRLTEMGADAYAQVAAGPFSADRRLARLRELLDGESTAVQPVRA